MGEARSQRVARRSHVMELTAVSTRAVTPGMLRITLALDHPEPGDVDLSLPDDHLRVVLPDSGAAQPRRPERVGDRLRWPAPHPATRDYTVRAWRPRQRELDLDVVLHHEAPGASWAVALRPGDRVCAVGPRPSVRVGPEFRHHVLLADETGLPAVARWLEQLPAGSRATAAVEVAGPGEEQPLEVPTGSTLTWLHRDGAEPGTSGVLGAYVSTLPDPGLEPTYVFAAAEAGELRPVRRWASAHGIGLNQCTISGYWRRAASRSPVA